MRNQTPVLKSSSLSLAPTLTHFFSALTRASHFAWWYLRQISGDAAYENYLRHQRDIAAAPLNPTQFYQESLKRKYVTINRCC